MTGRFARAGAAEVAQVSVPHRRAHAPWPAEAGARQELIARSTRCTAAGTAAGRRAREFGGRASGSAAGTSPLFGGGADTYTAAADIAKQMGLFPKARGATPQPEPEPEPEPEQEPDPDDVDVEELRQQGKKRPKKKAGQFAGAKEVASRNKKKGKDKVSRENMLLGRLEKQGEAYKQDGDTLLELAALYEERARWGQAIHYYKLALRASPDSREAIVPGLANAYFEHEMFEEAQFLYQDAVKKPAHVRSPRVWYHLGVIYERQLKWEIAEYCLRHSLTLLPPLERDVEIHCRLATCSNRLGHTAGAVASQKSACSSSSSSSSASAKQ